MQYIPQIKELALMTSCGCNLNCSYCEIAKSAQEHKKAIELQKKTVEALKDNSFVFNVKKGLNRIGSSSAGISRLEFWGQEPTLTLNYITDNIKTWKEIFPNVKNYMFSTNGVAYTDRILNFIDALDNSYNSDILFEIQFSYDGIESNTENRKLDSNLVKNNIIYFLTELNKKRLEHVSVDVAFHNVVSLNLINSLTSIEAINQYIINLYGTVEQFGKINTHKKVHVRPRPDAGVQVPVDASSEDGINFFRFYKMLNRAEENIKRDFVVSKNILNFEERGFQSVTNRIKESCQKTPYDIILEWTDNLDVFTKEVRQAFNQSSYCGAYLGELKIMYDGTLVNCHNQIFDTQIESFQKREKNIRNSVLKGLASHGRYPNLITSTDEELEKVFYLAQTAKEYNFLIGFNEISSLMFLLSKYNQIDRSYYTNQEKLLHHAMVLTKMNVCAVTRLVTTGSIFFTNAGQIRFFCNGLLDEIFSHTEGCFYKGGRNS